jgi:hypothetical protein
MEENGYTVKNTKGEDLDNNQTALKPKPILFYCVWNFWTFTKPYTILENVNCDKLLISIPLRLWFSPAYRSKTDKWDRHYHEFEDWQLTGFLKNRMENYYEKKFTHPVKKLVFALCCYGFSRDIIWFTLKIKN